MNTLIVAFSTQKPGHDHLRSKLVRYFDGVPYSHSFLILGPLVFHAVGEGVCTSTFDLLLTEAEIVKTFTFNLTEAQEVYLHGFIKGCVGKEYSHTQLVAIILAKKLGIDRAIFRNGTAKYICSELCADVLAEIGIEVPGCHDLITPRDLMEFLEKRERLSRETPPK